MGNCSLRAVRAWKPLLPHSGGNVPNTMGSCSSRSARTGKPLLPHDAGSVATTGKSSSCKTESSGNASTPAQDSGSVPAISCQRCHHHVLSQSRRKRCHVLRFPSLNAFIMSARVLECMSGRLRYECVQMLQGHGTTSEPDIRLTCVQTPQRYMNSEAQPICSFWKISRFLARSRSPVVISLQDASADPEAAEIHCWVYGTHSSL